MSCAESPRGSSPNHPLNLLRNTLYEFDESPSIRCPAAPGRATKDGSANHPRVVHAGDDRYPASESSEGGQVAEGAVLVTFPDAGAGAGTGDPPE